MKTAYRRVQPCVVAICSRVSKNPDFPDVIGTGVIIESDGLVLTNEHVLKKIMKLPRIKGRPKDEWPALCMLFHFIEGKGMAQIQLEIEGIIGVGAYAAENYYGEVPDVGIIRLKMKGLPFIPIVEKFNLEPGEEVGIAGFPMGTDTLRAPGWMHQICPTLKIGYISAVLPFQCDAPHEILIDSQTQGGNSGSPVFNKSGEIVGLLSSGLSDIDILNINGIKVPYKVPTNLSYAIPCQLISRIVTQMKDNDEYKNHVVNAIEFSDYLKKTKHTTLEPKGPNINMVLVEESDVTTSQNGVGN